MENQSEWTEGPESGNGDDVDGAVLILDVLSDNNTPECVVHLDTDSNGGCVNDVNEGRDAHGGRQQFGFLSQEPDESNCVVLFPEGNRNELSGDLNCIAMESRLDDTVSSNKNDNEFRDEGNVDNDSKSHYLDNKGMKLERNRGVVPPSHQQTARQKPGVILLGRGNSFSLGRSEVILLHNRPKAKSMKNRKSENIGLISNNDEKLLTIRESRASVDSDDVLRLNVTEGGDSDSDRVGDDSIKIPSSSPPPVSNGLSHPGSQQTVLNRDIVSDDDPSSRVIELVPCYEEDLQDLWLKAEWMMTRRNDKVRKILEEFGIGEPGGGGGEDDNCWEDEDLEERKKEEEEVWQMIQES